MPTCALHHLEEVAGRVERLQFLVQQVIIPGVPSDGLVISQHPAKHAVGRGHLLQETDHAARRLHLLVRRFRPAAAQQHGVAHDLLGLPARIHVVTDVGDALGSQRRADRRKNRPLHFVRHPAVHPVADDEIELPQRRQVHARDVARQQLEVVKAERLRALATLVDVHLRQIDAHCARARMARGERDQVAPGRTADFQHSRAGHLGCAQPEQIGDRGQVSRRRLRISMRVVGRGVVVSTHLVNRFVRCPAPIHRARNHGAFPRNDASRVWVRDGFTAFVFRIRSAFLVQMASRSGHSSRRESRLDAWASTMHSPDWDQHPGPLCVCRDRTPGVSRVQPARRIRYLQGRPARPSSARPGRCLRGGRPFSTGARPRHADHRAGSRSGCGS